MTCSPARFEPPLIIISLIPVTFFSFKLAKMVYLYHRRVDATLLKTLASALAGLALTHTIAKAVLYGFISRDLPFFRTPKRVTVSALHTAVQAAREEGMMAVALLLAMHAVISVQGTDSPDLLFWVAVLVIQAIPYLAAVILSFVAAGAQVSVRLIAGITEPLAGESGRRVEEPVHPALAERTTHGV
jgi:hypothetical protein